jgi:dienelactone hydrolase
MANYQPDLKALGWQSGTLKAVWDNRRGLDLLDSMPFVKRGKYGALGHSLGGHNAIYTALFDERIKVVVSSCGFDSYLDYYGGDLKNWELGRGWCQERYLPKLADYRGRLAEIPFDFHELLGASARSTRVNSPTPR